MIPICSAKITPLIPQLQNLLALYKLSATISTSCCSFKLVCLALLVCSVWLLKTGLLLNKPPNFYRGKDCFSLYSICPMHFLRSLSSAKLLCLILYSPSELLSFFYIKFLDYSLMDQTILHSQKYSVLLMTGTSKNLSSLSSL